MDASTFTTQGFALFPKVLGEAECESLASRLAAVAPDSAGTRGLLSQPWCQALAAGLRRHPSLAPLLPGDFAAVQCTYFEKSASRNWLVPVHQDLSIPVAARVEHPGLSGWSEKEGALHVQPPVELLRQLVALRLHIDACGIEDGPLRVVPSSHLQGRMDEQAAAKARHSQTEVICTLGRGGVMAMRPLLLHASSKSSGSSRRRVLHFLFGPRILPLGLQWQQAV
ncbi:protein involved in biosynthesis of mitomycin antibiotics/polyketide fumonisin [Polaromonas sp. CF318]|uniref:phytanoyl-CoA dioxygenase family protein n=1 Tax=Polaromonas sp. CF318 TaxID=1144318 RepID=UPI000270DB80|nr:phytanoyl-CoA dioxygenase family protein [Polaromonas sp. CF318]EJL80925.1 protein involved in biosynthesis of mitomycin antibiotics/polyketide fumonisin [Polaromonas sp. CF318]